MNDFQPAADSLSQTPEIVLAGSAVVATLLVVRALFEWVTRP
jgi:hypothetical protein